MNYCEDLGEIIAIHLRKKGEYFCLLLIFSVAERIIAYFYNVLVDGGAGFCPQQKISQ